MDTNVTATIKKRIDRTVERLKENNMGAYYAADRAQALEIVESLLRDGDTVTHGGSVTLKEIGASALLKSGRYNYLDRDREGITPDEVQALYRQAFSADAYLMSANAVTENGELYNVDGNGNRVAALIFGPKKVIVVAGYNKLVRDIDEAARRVKLIAAPANCERLSCPTPCSKTGRCVSLEHNGAYLCDGCITDKRICCDYVVSARQRIPDRIHVILVGEDLGY